MSQEQELSQEPERSEELVIAAEEDGSRLDRVLAQRVADLSRSRHKALILAGRVAIDGATIRDPGHRVNAGGRIRLDLPPPEETEIAAEDIPLDVVFEDDDLIIIDKPAGLVVHPGAGNWTGTLVNALIHHCGDSLSGIGGVKRPGIVHRLDKETSGVMVVAKTDRAHKALSEAFADHGRTGDLKRAYLALVWGIPTRPTGTIETSLGRAADRVRRAVVPEGRDDARHAITHFTVVKRFGEAQREFATASLVECRLETGRTHQIRVHMAHIGHPVLGDPDYGLAFRTKANRLPEPLKSQVIAFPRQALHAWLLEFRHPATHLTMRFEAPIPRDMEELIGGFRKL